MPDENKMEKAREVNLRVAECCGNCVHRVRTWGEVCDCKLHDYFHLKHASLRQMPAFRYFVCDSHELDEAQMERQAGQYAKEEWRK